MKGVASPMLCSVREVQRTAVEANDGRIGSVEAMLFDDVSWVIRYLVVDTGSWLPGRRVLISPISVDAHDGGERVRVRLDREQIRSSPDIDTDQPVSRQMETALHRYYGYAPYWGGGGIWGAALYPGALASTALAKASPHERSQSLKSGQVARESDPHLRSTREVQGYHIEASDGDAGHVDDFLFELESWAIWRLVIDTSNWPGGRSVLLPPARVRAIEWSASRLYVDMTRERIHASPVFQTSDLLTQTPEARAR